MAFRETFCFHYVGHGPKLIKWILAPTFIGPCLVKAAHCSVLVCATYLNIMLIINNMFLGGLGLGVAPTNGV